MTKRKHVWDDPRNVKRLIGAFLAADVVILALDFFVHRHSPFEHGSVAVEGWFGFYAFYGFVACVLLVLTAKGMRHIVKRDETYYGPIQPEGPGEPPAEVEDPHA